MTTTYGNLEDSMQKSQTWFKELYESSNEIGSKHEAQSIFRAVIHVLRDRMTIEELAHLSAQLPTVIRGIYFEEWNPTKNPSNFNRDQFVSAVKQNLVSRKSYINAEHAISLVFSLLNRHITSGEISHVRGMLPKGIDALWEGKKAA